MSSPSPYDMSRAVTIGMAVVALAGGAGCGGSGGGKLVAASRPDQELVAAVPDPFDSGARQAPNTFVGKIGRAGWAYVAVVTRGDRALIYLCDGRASEWFGAPIRGGRVLVRSFNGTVVDARVQAGRVRGTVRPRGQGAGAFVAVRPNGPGIGLFKGPDPAVRGHVRRWIVLADGVRGVSDPPAADVVAGAGTVTRANTTPAAPTTVQTVTSPPPPPATTPPPAGDVVAGSGTATKAKSTPAAPATTVQTVTTPTATKPQSTSTVSDGTSNTIIIGETSTTPQGGGSVRTIGATTPPAATTQQGGGSAQTTTTATSSISDGTSNTLVLGVDPINGIAAGATLPPVPPALPVTTCPVLQPCPPVPPASITAGKAGATTISTTPNGKLNLFPGGASIDCRTLATLIASLAAPAKKGNAAAIKQLGVLLAQAKANRC